MLLLASALAFAADPPPSYAQVLYLEDSPSLAVRTAEALVAAHPDDTDAWALYLRESVFTWRPPEERAALRGEVAAWRAAAPDDDSRRVVLAMATAFAASDANAVPDTKGPWCDEALGLLSPPPRDPAARARADWFEIEIDRRCGRDPADARARVLADEKASAWGQLHAAALLASHETIDTAGAKVIAAAAKRSPWYLTALAGVFRATGGDGAQTARHAVLAVAKASAASHDPALVAQAADVLWDSGDDVGAAAARQALRALDPKRPVYDPPPRNATPTAPAPATIGNPTATLASLGSHPPKGRSNRADWYQRRGQALLALGRGSDALRAYRRYYATDPGIGGNLAFAELALKQHRDLVAATRAASIAIDSEQWTAADDDAQLARALAARGRLWLARGRSNKARPDLELSLALVADPAVRLDVARLAARADSPEQALPELAGALARAPGTAGDLRTLGKLADATGLWLPRGPAGLVAAWPRTEVVPPAAAPTKRTPFPPLSFQIDGRDATLANFDKPVIVDIWATWCGPCKQALPRFDAAARAHPEIAFVAISVDARASEAAAYLAKSSPAFTAAWAGPKALQTLGISAIPHFFALDRKHAIVDEGEGFGLGGGEFQKLARELAQASQAPASEKAKGQGAEVPGG